MKNFKFLIVSSLIFGVLTTGTVDASNKDQADKTVTNPTGMSVYRQSRSIIGNDNRTKITNTTLSPYSSIVHTAVPYDVALGSGAVVGKNIILTAAHVAKSFSKTKDSFVIPGRNGRNSPFGKFQVKGVYIHPDYGKGSNHDIAILVLMANEKGQNIGDVVPILKTNPNFSLNETITLPGYGADKRGELWESTGRVVNQDTYRLYHTADTYSGNSGSPILNSKQEIIGVHVTGGSTNGAVKLTDNNYTFIQKYIGQEFPSIPEFTAPTLTGVTNKEITVGDPFDKRAGIKATDKIDGEITAQIKISGNIDNQKIGTYVLTYSVTNSKGKTTTLNRTVIVKAKSSVTPPTNNSIWDANKVYTGGEVVSYNNKIYKAKWWVQYQTPDQSNAWEQIVLPNSDGSIDYVKGKPYSTGNIVKYNEKNYKARWWTTTIPGSDNSWQVI